MENQKCIICYHTQPRSGEYTQSLWTDEYESLEEFKKVCPLAEVVYVYYAVDKLVI